MTTTHNTYKVCFVCSGNACRSPFAECVTRELLSRNGIDNISVYSVGTLDWGVNPRDEAMVDVAREMGYTMDGQTTHMTYENLSEADIIIVFEPKHRNAITQVLDYDRWNKIILFDTLAFGKDDSVEDPFFKTEAVYQQVSEHIEKGCKNIVSSWLQSPPNLFFKSQSE